MRNKSRDRIMDIREISFQQIREVWSNKLWPGRELIEPVSAMVYLQGYSMEHFNLPVIYYGIFEDNLLVGVNSGHLCSDNSFRSRGLWVDPTCRGKGYGIALLKRTVNYGRVLRCDFCWSLPRQTSWTTYEKVGFSRTTEWMSTDTSSANAYCRLDY